MTPTLLACFESHPVIMQPHLSHVTPSSLWAAECLRHVMHAPVPSNNVVVANEMHVMSLSIGGVGHERVLARTAVRPGDEMHLEPPIFVRENEALHLYRDHTRVAVLTPPRAAFFTVIVFYNGMVLFEAGGAHAHSVFV